MGNGKLHDDEVDIFEPVEPVPGPISSEEHIETETNVFSVDALKHAAAQYNATVGLPAAAVADAEDDVFEASTPAHPAGGDTAIDGGDEGLDSDDDLDDDVPAPKQGFFARLFNRNKNTKIDDLSLDEDDDMPSTEPEPAATAPEVTDSGVFELGAPSVEPEPEPEPVATVPEVTDSGVFELGAPSVEPEPEPEPVATVPEVTDSGVFELQAPTPKATGGEEWEIGWEPEDEKTTGAAPAEAETPASPPPVFTKLAHVCLYVDNLARSVEFYGKLGFQKRFVFNRNGNLFGAYLEFGDGNFIELFEDPARAISAAPGRLAHFCLETPDIEATMASLTARGIGFTPKKLGCDSTYQIWLKDPDGNEFEIHQYTPESSQIVGGVVEADW
jgi:lactoylglutathione lyase/glyoxylase I family protein